MMISGNLSLEYLETCNSSGKQWKDNPTMQRNQWNKGTRSQSTMLGLKCFKCVELGPKSSESRKAHSSGSKQLMIEEHDNEGMLPHGEEAAYDDSTKKAICLFFSF